MLLIRKDNDGTVIGVNYVFEGEDKLAIADSIYPSLMPEIETTSFGGKALIVIRVSILERPFYLKAQEPEKRGICQVRFN
ncbi:MAG: hypothetical protein H0V82_05435 [Candidatus Protochlamydia sp.]|nr:hypothetical protein [Candidatus Protochlamydia sp.]